MNAPLLEICVETPAGIAAAADGGANRIELCAALAIGGLTPPASLVRVAARGPLPVHMLCRPRAGGFLCDHHDRALVADDIRVAAEAGLAGVAIGASRADHRLDTDTLAGWIAHARALGAARDRPLSLTLHRAFDLAPDLDAALDEAAALGFDRILTSGGGPRAIDGIAALGRLARRGAGRVVILAAGGVDAATAPALLAAGIRELHASCRAPAVARPCLARDLGFGDPAPPQTDAKRVRALADTLVAARKR